MDLTNSFTIIHVAGRVAQPVPNDGRVTGPYCDVNADGSVAPSDALDVINHINALGSSEGEGESKWKQDALAGYQAAAGSPIGENDLLALLFIDIASQPKHRR